MKSRNPSLSWYLALTPSSDMCGLFWHPNLCGYDCNMEHMSDLERQDLSRTYQVHHELESVFLVCIFIF